MLDNGWSIAGAEVEWSGHFTIQLLIAGVCVHDSHNFCSDWNDCDDASHILFLFVI